jgi:hypothetical protein
MLLIHLEHCRQAHQHAQEQQEIVTPTLQVKQSSLLAATPIQMRLGQHL